MYVRVYKCFTTLLQLHYYQTTIFQVLMNRKLKVICNRMVIHFDLHREVNGYTTVMLQCNFNYITLCQYFCDVRMYVCMYVFAYLRTYAVKACVVMN